MFEFNKRINSDALIDYLGNNCRQLLKRLIDSKCKTEFIDKTKEEI